MVTRIRLHRLARQVEARTPPPPTEPAVEVWLPDNGRGDRPPGRYPLPGGKAVLVIYDAGEEPLQRGDEGRRVTSPA